MKATHAAFLCCLIALVCSVVRADQPAANQNAAHVLRPLFEQLRAVWEKAGYLDVVSLYEPATHAPPTPESIDAVKQYLRGPARPVTEAIIAATRIEHCDWEIDATQGPTAKLFHLGDARIVALHLCADAHVRFDDNDPSAAAEDYAAMLRLARQARGTDAFLVSSMSSASIAHLAGKEILHALERGRFDGTQKRRLLEAIEQLDLNDPFHVRDAIAADGGVLIDWLRRAYQPGKMKTPEMTEYVAMSRGSSRAQERAEQLQELMKRGEPLEPQLTQLRSFHDAMLAAWDGPTPSDALRALAQQAEAGKYGEMTALVFPFALAGARETHDKAIAEFKLLRKRLAD